MKRKAELICLDWLFLLDTFWIQRHLNKLNKSIQMNSVCVVPSHLQPIW